MLFAMLFAIETPTVSGDNIITLGTLGTGLVGIVAWILKSALPGLLGKFEQFIAKFESLVDKKDEAAKQERAALAAAHAQQMEKREATFQQLAENISENTNAIAALTTQIASMQGNQVAPEPRTKQQRGQ